MVAGLPARPTPTVEATAYCSFDRLRSARNRTECALAVGPQTHRSCCREQQKDVTNRLTGTKERLHSFVGHLFASRSARSRIHLPGTGLQVRAHSRAPPNA